MRILIASLASPGFLYPLIAVAHKALSRGHAVRCCTDVGYGMILEQHGLKRVARGDRDGASFATATWHNEVDVAIQVKHLEYAIGHERPDVILCSSLTLGPLIVRDLYSIPVAVLGPMVQLWNDPSASPRSQRDERQAWRYQDYFQHYNKARFALGLGLSRDDFANSPLFGDAFYLQSVPEFSPNDIPHPKVSYVGSCVVPLENEEHDGEAAEWAARQRDHGRSLLYAQLSRSFEHESFWPPLEAFLARSNCAAVCSVGRYDRSFSRSHDKIFARGHLSQFHALRSVDATVCAGHPAAILGTIAAKKPLVVCFTGSGTDDNAESCADQGIGIAVDVDHAAPSSVGEAVHSVLTERRFEVAAKEMQARFASYDGPGLVCESMEALGHEPSFAISHA